MCQTAVIIAVSIRSDSMLFLLHLLAILLEIFVILLVWITSNFNFGYFWSHNGVWVLTSQVKNKWSFFSSLLPYSLHIVVWSLHHFVTLSKVLSMFNGARCVNIDIFGGHNAIPYMMVPSLVFLAFSSRFQVQGHLCLFFWSYFFCLKFKQYLLFIYLDRKLMI